MISSKKNYLDTNAVRRLGKELPKIAPDCFTSAFTIMELLSGISEKEYSIRKNVLSILLSSEMEIDWQMPINIITKAFGQVPRPDELQASDLKEIVNALQISTSYADFLERNKALQPDINWLKLFDQRLSLQFKNVFATKKSQIREEKSKGSASLFTPIKEKGIYGLAEFICEKYLPETLRGRVDEISRKYDGSIDRFIEAWLGYYNLNANSLNESATNDWADVLHTVYLNSNSDIVFISDDRKIRELINSFRLGAALSVDEFKVKLE